MTSAAPRRLLLPFYATFTGWLEGTVGGLCCFCLEGGDFGERALGASWVKRRKVFCNTYYGAHSSDAYAAAFYALLARGGGMMGCTA